MRYSHWTSNLYNKLYVNTASAIEQHNGFKTLREIVHASNGDEVGSENYLEFTERKKSDIPFIRTSDIVNFEVDLYPDYYIPPEALKDVKQKVQPKDVIFTKDGKIGCAGMITEEDNVILSSGIEILRVSKEGLKLGFTPEYVFLALSTKEIGYYAAIRRTVVACSGGEETNQGSEASSRHHRGGGQYNPPYRCGPAFRRRKKADKGSHPHKPSMWEGLPKKYEAD